MSPPDPIALRDYLSPELQSRTISNAHKTISLTNILKVSCFGEHARKICGRSVLLAVHDQMLAAIAMIELDGITARMLLCPPDIDLEYMPALIENAGIDLVVTDDASRWAGHGIDTVEAQMCLRDAAPATSKYATEWLMLTSGTTGVPKIVSHTLSGLTGAIVADGRMHGVSPVWATFYDIRRYGGLQIWLRAIVGGGSMVLSQPDEPIADHLARLNARAVSHISGTPTHWRKVLMSGEAGSFAPRYVRLSGEIADQAVLDALKRAFPAASIGHAYASTEAGVGFAVNDGLEGFPASMLGVSCDGIEMTVKDGSLRIRSARTARAYVGSNAAALYDADGFIDTGDMVELRGDRYHFVGRNGGIMNIGGLKVHPEEIEAVINRNAAVRMCRAKSRRSPITGAIVVADVVLADDCSPLQSDATRNEILASCRASLAPYKIPAVITFVHSLEITAAGKLARLDG